jgi:hypothetical protein|tara:strand:+ start:981 stop:1475 length:495 start_codon:yes stop_codon:yes gene_type:complete
MAQRIKFEHVGKHVEGNYNKLIKRAVAETYGSLVQKSPVDTGRFKASWVVGENSATFPGEPAGKSSYQTPNPEQPRKIGYDKEKAGNTYIVYNNLPYADKLATAAAGSGKKTVTRYNPKREVQTWETPGEGSSYQTNGPGWVQATAKRVQRMIPTLAARIEAGL